MTEHKKTGIPWRPLALLAAAGLLALSAGCSDDGPGVVDTVECQTDAECTDADAGPFCLEGACSVCTSDTQCAQSPDFGEGFICLEGVCTPPECGPGEPGCDCLDGQHCLEGAGCEDGTCTHCVEGASQCACGPEDTCQDGLECRGGVCVDATCSPGQEGCDCAQGDACEGAELICSNGVCRTCPDTVVGCPCREGDCGGELLCDNTTDRCEAVAPCADSNCGEHRLCGGDGTVCLEACEDGFVFDEGSGQCFDTAPSCDPEAFNSILADCDARNEVCVDGEPEARCEGCQEGFLDDGEGCRAIQSCDDLGCAAQNRACDPEGDDSDAVCGGCLEGFLLDNGLCELDLTANCNDDPNDTNSILQSCTDQMRVCSPDLAGATCGDCLRGFAEDRDTGSCRLIETFPACDDTESCDEGLFCISLEADAPLHCLQAPCPEGQTWDLRDQVCVDTCDCTGAGVTGVPWPVTDRNGDCVCETAPGFFFNASTGFRRAEPCDDDTDGWTRRSAFEYLIPSADPAVRANARCALRTIDRFSLINEFGQREDVSVEVLSNATLQFEELFEPDESDDDGDTSEAQESDHGARRFLAAEVNPLTKACVSANADLNRNAISDLREHHLGTPGDRDLSWMATFVKMGYFVELHHGWYEPPQEGQEHGRFVIMERSRCEDAFLLNYDDGEGDYWQQCSRRRDARYAPLAPFGYDFGRWSCDEGSGACPPLPPTTTEEPSGRIPAHGLCEDRQGEDPAPWRGMNHASQFRCVEVISDAQQQDVEPFHLRESAVFSEANPAGRQHLNRCGLVSCDDQDDPDCEDSVILGPIQDNVYEAAMSCQSQSSELVGNVETLVGAVAWVATRYEEYDDPEEYAGGCIDESAEWSVLCPGFDPQVPGRIASQGAPSNFGRLLCGCGFNYGGVDCELGCPDAQLNFGGPHGDEEGFCEGGYCVTIPTDNGLDGGRSGFWMCGDFSASLSADPRNGGVLDGDGFEVFGEVPLHGTDRAPLCQAIDENGDCTGFTVH